LHEFVGSGQAIEAVDPKYSSLHVGRLVLEKVKAKEAEVFENGIHF
jgi:hypothetical protein